MKKASKIRDLDLPNACRGADHKAIQELMSQVGDKWTMSVIGTLAHLPRHRARFSQLERLIAGISQRMLTSTLRSLERDGIVEREFFAEVPPRVEYELSKLGHSLIIPIKGLVDWVNTNSVKVKKAREKFDRAAAQKKLRSIS